MLKGPGSEPRWLITDKLRSYAAPHRATMPSVVLDIRRWGNNLSGLTSAGPAPKELTEGLVDAAVEVGLERAELAMGVVGLRPHPAAPFVEIIAVLLSGLSLEELQDALARLHARVVPVGELGVIGLLPAASTQPRALSPRSPDGRKRTHSSRSAA